MAKFNFRHWRLSQQFSKAEAAKALGISVSSVSLYEAGKRFDNGKPVVIPRTVELACQQIAATQRAAAEHAKAVAQRTEHTKLNSWEVTHE